MVIKNIWLFCIKIYNYLTGLTKNKRSKNYGEVRESGELPYRKPDSLKGLPEIL